MINNKYLKCIRALANEIVELKDRIKVLEDDKAQQIKLSKATNIRYGNK